MPSRNVVKNYDTNTYYHVYNRGADKRVIFIDDQDYSTFLSLFKRYLDPYNEDAYRGNCYSSLVDKVEIVAFCLMPNHFHLLLYQIEIDSITCLMRAVCSSYGNYFNKKYKRTGSLFQGIFKAVRIENDGYLQYISRYIHRNPSDYLGWEWSSLRYWLGDKHATWINNVKLNTINRRQYLEYLCDDCSYTESVEEIYSIILENV